MCVFFVFVGLMGSELPITVVSSVGKAENSLFFLVLVC